MLSKNRIKYIRSLEMKNTGKPKKHFWPKATNWYTTCWDIFPANCW